MATGHPYPPPTYVSLEYPVQVETDGPPVVSRWLWLVKWLLAVPHYVVLAFLWLAFAVLSTVAFFAILFTGRYPHAIFDFNVGVLRWSWRVAYYSYGALATDRYPPFSLAEDDQYPAHLEVDYPDHLSRGLLLLKWWLLAIPHYIVVGIFLGAGAWAVREGNGSQWAWGGGLAGILVLVAAVVLTVTGTYPRPVYDLLLGVNRWVLRVAAYAALMTDQYPPFRLDQGPHEPTGALVVTHPHRAALEPPAHHSSGWTAGRALSVVTGAVLILFALGLLFGGTATLVADRTMRDDGYLTSDVNRLSSNGLAVVAGDVLLEVPGLQSTSLPAQVAGDVRVRVTPEHPSSPVFVGIARNDDLQAYLAGVGPSTAPATLGIWDAQAVGTGEQELVWTPRTGRWSMVLMNADATPGVAADVDVGLTVPWLPWAGAALVLAGVVTLTGGAVFITIAVQLASRRRS